MNPLRIAVIGAGRLGGFHAQKLAAAKDVDLVAVVDPLAANRNRVAAQCQSEPLADHRSLLDRIDAAIIAAPTRLHHSLALSFLRRGIHLLVEKPLCCIPAEADELVETARRENLVLQVGHIERFNPAFVAAAPEVENAKYIEAVRASGFTFRCTDVGVVLDLMIHDIDLALSLANSKVCRVEALGLSVFGGHEDVANARLHFESGCIATLSASRASREAVRRMSIFSPRAWASVDFAARTAEVTRPSDRLLKRRFDVDGLTTEQVDHYKDHLLDEHLPCVKQQFEAVDALAVQTDDFLQSIRTARKPRVSGEAGRDAVAVAEQILSCIERHAWDGSTQGPVGPLATPDRRVAPPPHFRLAPSDSPLRKAS